MARSSTWASRVLSVSQKRRHSASPAKLPFPPALNIPDDLFLAETTSGSASRLPCCPAVAIASAPLSGCPSGRPSRPARRRSFSRQLSPRMLIVVEWCSSRSNIAVAMIGSPSNHNGVGRGGRAGFGHPVACGAYEQADDGSLQPCTACREARGYGRACWRSHESETSAGAGVGQT